jgi:hypothetical protein
MVAMTLSPAPVTSNTLRGGGHVERGRPLEEAHAAPPRVTRTARVPRREARARRAEVVGPRSRSPVACSASSWFSHDRACR